MKRKLLFSATAAAVAAAQVLLSSCGPSRIVPDRAQPRPVYQSADPLALLEAIGRRNSRITGLQSEGRLEYRFTYSTRSLRGTDIRLQFAKPGSVYVRGFVRLAGTIFRLVTDGDNFWAENTRDGEVYVGRAARAIRREEIEEIWEGLHPTVLAEALLLDDIEPAQTVCETRPDHYIIELLGRGADGKLSLRRRIWIEREHLRVRRHQVYSPAGELVTEASLFLYRPVEGAEGIELAHRIVIDRPWEELRLQLDFERIVLNPEFNEELFQYSVPSGFRIVDLERQETDQDAQHR